MIAAARFTHAVMNQDEQKLKVAQAALAEVEPHLDRDTVIGVGTGSTANHFIDALGEVRHKFDAAVASSNATAERLKDVGVKVIELTAAPPMAFYVDGADEVTTRGFMIKGGGGALTREKIVASAADRFVCIVDASKVVGILGAYPLPIEVIPMARSVVARRLVELGGQPELRADFTTDNGNLILDVHNLQIENPQAMEVTLNNIPGVVSCGVFAANAAALVLCALADGTVQRIVPD